MELPECLVKIFNMELLVQEAVGTFFSINRVKEFVIGQLTAILKKIIYDTPSVIK